MGWDRTANGWISIFPSGFKSRRRAAENLREHYALTLCHWVKRLAQRRVAAVKASDGVTYRTWQLYISASAYGFESGNINVNQTLLVKMTREGKSSVLLSRADLYL